MKYDQTEEFSDEQFRRLTGVKRSTFKKMIEILREADHKKKTRGGRKSKLSLANRLLMALEYIREYRTYFHIATSYGVSESVAYKIVRWVEDTLDILRNLPILSVNSQKIYSHFLFLQNKTQSCKDAKNGK